MLSCIVKKNASKMGLVPRVVLISLSASPQNSTLLANAPDGAIMVEKSLSYERLGIARTSINKNPNGATSERGGHHD
jgi:hypothetical protein